MKLLCLSAAERHKTGLPGNVDIVLRFAFLPVYLAKTGQAKREGHMFGRYGVTHMKQIGNGN